MNLKILILDDMSERHDGFIKVYKDRDVELFHAHNFAEFTKWLSEETFDIIWLDHDLGDVADGVDAARACLRLGYNPHIFIHSANIIGAAKMQRILQDGGVPACTFNFFSILSGLLPHN